MLPITVNWERSPSAPTPVFGYNTKQNYSPQPTDNIYDDGRFDKINPNVFMGKRASDGKLNFNQYGKMFSQDNNSAWESNVSWAGNTGMSKRANYQGESVNFDQELNSSQLSSIVIQDIIPRLNKIQMEYPQDPFSASAKSDTDVWNHINRYIWGKSGAESSPEGDWAANPNAPIPQIWKNKDNISTNLQRSSVIHKDLQRQLNEAKDERDSIQEKLEGKAMRNHTHQGLGLPPITITTPKPPSLNPFDNLIPSLSLTTIALGGLAAYFLLGKK